ncbi:hypothetical protein ACEZDB_01180 [Streptacidiphilus sp. N1-3]|uniref:Alpha-amylase n=1 Tax=Streptacidiphilus alkalitolerans TaxID=3342712 RepID=A0ABV6WTB6_9ACTN
MAAAAPSPGSGAVYGAWDLAGGSGSMQIPLGGFPEAAVRSTGSPAKVQSGQSAFLGAATPVGKRYGSSQGRPYVNIGAASGQSASVTTLDFAAPTPAGTWAFTLGDVDADRVQVQAFGAGGQPLSSAQLGWQGAFNYCDNSPKPSSCVGPGPFTDVPVWHPDTATLTGNVVDTNGASGWFQPTVPVSKVTLTFSVQIGIPIYQIWTSSLATDVRGTVSSDCGTPVGTTVTLRRAGSGGKAVTGPDGKPLTAPVAADGSYRFTDLAPGDYRAVLAAPAGYSPSTVSAAADTSDGGDVTGADLRLTCDPIPAPPQPPVMIPVSGGWFVILVPPGPGPSGDAEPQIIDPPEHGKVRVGPGNKLAYAPERGFVGDDRFTYVSRDREGRLISHTVTLHVRSTLADTGSSLPALPLLGLSGALAGTGLVVLGAVRRRRRAD